MYPKGYLYQYDGKNKRKNVVGAKKSYLYFNTHSLIPRTLEIVCQSFQISNFSGGGILPDPPSKRGLVVPCQYGHLLFSN